GELRGGRGIIHNKTRDRRPQRDRVLRVRVGGHRTAHLGTDHLGDERDARRSTDEKDPGDELSENTASRSERFETSDRSRSSALRVMVSLPARQSPLSSMSSGMNSNSPPTGMAVKARSLLAGAVGRLEEVGDAALRADVLLAEVGARVPEAVAEHVAGIADLRVDRVDHAL